MSSTSYNIEGALYELVARGNKDVYFFEDTKDAGDLFALRKYGNIYSRIANPTVAALEEKVAALEGGLGAVATSS